MRSGYPVFSHSRFWLISISSTAIATIPPDSREPWFVSAAHDRACLDETLSTFEYCVDLTLEELGQSRQAKASPVMTGITA